jgi:hypothetical protein
MEISQNFMIFIKHLGLLTNCPYNECKGQLISKAIYGLLTSPKKRRTDEFDLFAFLLFTANKTNSSVRILGESTARQSAFRNYLTFKYLTVCSIYIFSFILVSILKSFQF